MEKTIQQYDKVLARCKDVFVKKTKDYGTAWRILRSTSLTDQLLIKASRIRSLEELEEQKVEETVDSEYLGLVNYSIMALIQLEHRDGKDLEWELDKTVGLYDTYAQMIKDLMIAKNHDYGEAWRDLRLSSLTDLILMKLLRIKQIEDNEGKTIISEGLDANYMDIANYALFALIKLDEKD